MFGVFSKKTATELYRFFAALVIAALLLSLLPLATNAEGEQNDDNAEQVTQVENNDSDEDNEGGDGEEDLTSQDEEENTDGDEKDEQNDDTENEGDGSDGNDGTGTGTTTVSTGNGYAENNLNNEVNTNLIDTNGTSTPESTETGTSTPNTSTASSTDSGTEDGTGTSTPVHITASSTNEANVENFGTTTAETGDNTASSSPDGATEIETGTAVAVANIANVVNTNIINSNGFLLLLNWLFGYGQFDLRDLDFEAFSRGSSDSDFLSGRTQSNCEIDACEVADVDYTVTNSNTATTTNNQVVRASTGGNTASGGDASIETGNAYAAANVVNVANTNIIDSNYLLLTLNNIGSYIGDIVLPSAKFFSVLFGGGIFGGNTTIDNDNTATVDNNVSVDAETGDNTATGTSTVETGDAVADANVVNHINQNLVGGSSVNILFKVHGDWSGEIFGLPEGLAWDHTSEGIHIYSLGSDGGVGGGGSTTISNTNNAYIQNNVEVRALTGENKVEGGDGSIETGDAYAAANVVNVANTNVVGRNWIMALFNILGDFQGNISFGMPDLWIGGQAESPDSPVQNGSKVTYTYTIVNNGDAPATDLVLEQVFDPELLTFEGYEELSEDGGTATYGVGDLGPGESTEVAIDATVANPLSGGTTLLNVTSEVDERETDANHGDNTEEVVVEAQQEVHVTVGNSNNSSDDNDPDIDIAKFITNSTSTDHATFIATATTTSVDYMVTVTNDGGEAYSALLVDTITDDETGEVINEQTWDLGTILDDEVIEITYTIEFSPEDGSGSYTNTAHLDVYDTPQESSGGGGGGGLPIKNAKVTVGIEQPLAIDNVGVVGPYVTAGSGSAFVNWDTNVPADGQVFYSLLGDANYFESAPNYGYTHSSAYIAAPTTDHGIALVGLIPGATYVYRVASATSDDSAVSDEYTFVVPNPEPPVLETEELSTSSDESAGGGGGGADGSSDGGLQVAAAYASTAGIFDKLLTDPVCFGSFLLIILLLALFGLLVEWALGRRTLVPLDPMKRTAITVLGATGVTAAIAYLVATLSCLQIPVLILLALFAAIMYLRLGAVDVRSRFSGYLTRR